MKIALLGVSCGWGAKNPATALGPARFKETGILQALQAQTQAVKWQDLSTSTAYQKNLTLDYAQRQQEIEILNRQLSQRITSVMAQSYFPIVVGGDHAIAMGTWQGVITAQGAAEQFGLIWIDAHMDSHTPETSHSKSIHGMPLAALMGRWGPYGKQLNPAHIVLIGVRSFEPEEAALLKKLNVTVFFMEEVKQQGFKAIFSQAMDKVTQETKGFGISIDLDAFDPDDAPGTGTPCADGLRAEEVLPVLAGVGHHPMLKGLEIAEFNPLCDVNGKTAQLAKTLLLGIMQKETP